MRRNGGTAMPYQIEFSGQPQSGYNAVGLSRAPESGAIGEAHRSEKLADDGFAPSKVQSAVHHWRSTRRHPFAKSDFCPVTVITAQRAWAVQEEVTRQTAHFRTTVFCVA